MRVAEQVSVRAGDMLSPVSSSVLVESDSCADLLSACHVSRGVSYRLSSSHLASTALTLANIVLLPQLHPSKCNVA